MAAVLKSDVRKLTSAFSIDKLDARLKSVSAVAILLFLNIIILTNADLLFPEVADTLQDQLEFYNQMTLTTLLVFAIITIQKMQSAGRVKISKSSLPAFPPAVIAIRNYVLWFGIFWLITALLFIKLNLSIFPPTVSPTLATYSTGANSWILNLVIALNENLDAVMLFPIIFPFYLGKDEGLFARVREYLPSAVLASLLHASVYWRQAQTQASRTGADPYSIWFFSLGVAFVAFTIFYLIYKKWGFAASVAAHQTYNMNNSFLGGY